MSLHNYEKTIKKSIENINGRKLVLCGNDSLTVEVYKTLIDNNINLSYVITDNVDLISSLGINLRNTLLYEGFSFESIKKEECFVLVAQLDGHKEIYNSLINRGLKLDYDFSIFGIGGFSLRLNCIDSLLTLNRQYDDDLLGFKTMTNNNMGGCCIVVLGNSTSDPSTGNLKCWTEYLLDEFSNDSVKVTIYNGAITGYSSTQEFLKLNRDVFQLKPDIVLSFSGYNDISDNSYVQGFPFLHKYEKKFYDFLLLNKKLAPDSMFVRDVKSVVNGIPIDNEDWSIWIRNIDRMNAICTSEHVLFQGFLQPMLDYSNSIITDTSNIIIRDYVERIGAYNLSNNVRAFCNNVRLNIKNKSYIKDMTDIFSGQYDMFYDICHYTEEGNKIIARNVYEILKGMMNKKF